MQANFKGFTFVDDSSIDEHMRNLGIKNNYYNTDGDERRNQGWEEPLDTHEDEM
jgi:protein-serine/threonine kinase